ncbi:hypothetical protein B0H34DRAFT_427965 [Crassisporium funariophilum]|nr:hypothetical protein B0H34DRAFT_427965 [Crassisporium funariophilum]
MKLSSYIGLIYILLAAAKVTKATAEGRRLEIRATATCVDPTTAVNAYQAYTPGWQAHLFDLNLANIVGGISTGSDWQYQGVLARMFPTPSNFTVPIYRLLGSPTDYLFLVSPTGKAPSVAGYSVDGVVAYVYPAQVCGTIPLYSVYNAALGDHWYTTDLAARNRMLQLAYIDSGIQGYVLPLDCGCSAF